MARQNRKNKKNGSRVKTKPGQSYRVYCPECENSGKTLNHPEDFVHMPVSGKIKAVTCPSGHRTKVS